MEQGLQEKDMNIKDDLYLSPFEKYKLYGVFPWGIAIAITLILLTSLQIILVITPHSNYSYQQIIVWNKVFLNDDVQGSDTSLTNSFNIFHYGKLQSYMSNAIDVI
jgi:hypothetical protein